jgi:predicted TIM-barrel fold metal-dependent hydrolase
MASINPHFTRDDYHGEAVRCIRRLGFVGIKLTPVAHAVNPGSNDGRFVFETAAELGVPVMVHTGAGMPFADPSKLLDVIPDFREIPIILAHAGTDMLFSQALYLARVYENVYLEPSWLNVLNIEACLKTVGSRKMMFSSDHAVNIPVELAKYKAAARRAEDLENILYKTAAAVFRLPV